MKFPKASKKMSGMKAVLSSIIPDSAAGGGPQSLIAPPTKGKKKGKMSFGARKSFGAALFLMLLLPTRAMAQTPIVVGPATTLGWFDTDLGPTVAQGCVFSVAKTTAGPFVPVIGPVTCTGVTAPATGSACQVNYFAQQATIPVGSGSIVMTATCSGQTSLPSTPFVYLTVIIPAPPTGLRLQG